MKNYLMRIIVNEQQREKKEQTFKAVLSYMWEQGVPGATLRRGNAGIDGHGRIEYDILEDVYFNNLPIIIESVMDKALVEKVEEGVKALVKDGQISITEGLDAHLIDENEYFVVKVYTSENKKKRLKKEDYEKVLTFLQKKKVIWATVTKGIAGYGKDHVIYSQHVFPLSDHMPLVVECIVDRENLSDLTEELKQIITDGVVFAFPVHVILNR